MKAYKVFNSDWTCRGFQFNVGETYEIGGKPELCERGFHACKKAADCFSYYQFDPKNKVAEVELLGEIVGEDGDKQATNKIKIVMEIQWQELLDIVNTGKGCTGLSNSGNSNSGSRNSGSRNSGNSNSGSRNSGNSNSGDFNSGSRNSGNSNSGDFNSGDFNSGSRNSGNSNSGDFNSGSRNSGSRNSGNRNSGHFNSGNWNSGDRNSGFFNTNEPTVRMFNKNTKKYRHGIDIPSWLYFDLTVFVSYDTATDEERVKYKKEIETCGGFLKSIDYKTAFRLAYDKATQSERDAVKKLPNFNSDIFFEISGIRL